MHELDNFNTALSQLPIVKKHFFQWAIDNKLLNITLRTAISKSYNMKTKNRSGNIEIKSFTEEEQIQIKQALKEYAVYIQKEIELF